MRRKWLAPDRRIRQVAEAVCDRHDIDWQGAERATSRGAGETIRGLRLLASLFPAASVHPDADRARIPLGYRLILLLAAAHVAGGVVGAVSASDTLPVPAAFQLTAVFVFAGSAGLLLWGGRHDSRPVYLGGFFLIVASALSVRFVPLVGGSAGTALAALATVRPEPFLPLFMWRFVREFPRVLRFSGSDRLSDAARTLSVVVGLTLLAAGAVRPFTEAGDVAGSLVRMLGRDGDVYWAVILGLLAPALPVAVVRSRAADPAERARVRTFAAIVAVTLALPVIEILAEILFPPFDALVSPPEMRRRLAGFFYLLLCAAPVLTSWVVLARRVFTLRLVVRRSLQWLLARGTLLACTLVPIAVLAWHGYANRARTLGDLLSGGPALALGASSAASALLLWARRPLADAVDRYFLRTPRDYASALEQLTSRLQAVDHPREIARIVEDTVTQVLAPECVALHLLPPGTDRLAPVRGLGRPLPQESALGAMLVADEVLLRVGPLDRASIFRLLPAADRDWVVDGPWAVLVPVTDPTRRVVGAIVVGPPGSDEPFRAAEVTFLHTVAAMTMLALSRRPADAAIDDGAGDAAGMECPACGIVTSCDGDSCTCGTVLTESVLPLVLAGKFRVTRRLGRGAMGVVYRADDLVLGRAVALKTLPRVSPDAALRLRREARSMALIAHPNLAAIHGAESWRGRPVLVVEYLAGGTLEERLVRGRLGLADAIEMAVALLDGLAHLHAAGYLHRDIKPSNIGFSGARAAKLLDFGLATLESRSGDAPATAHAPSVLDRELGTSGRPSHPGLAGTPMYLAPELLAGATASPSSDLWSLGIVLHEALTGVHPFAGGSPRDVLRRIRAGAVAPVPAWPAPIQAFFSRALAVSPAGRPPSAAAFAAELEALRTAADCSDRMM